jgi:DNA primase
LPSHSLEGDAFYQKRVPTGAPDWVQTARISFPSGRHADEICPVDLAHVGYCAQLGTIVFHPWPVRRSDVDSPDELRIDLDPQPGTDFGDAVAVAGEVRALLDELGWVGFPKTSGGRCTSTYGSSPAGVVDDACAAIAFARETNGASAPGHHLVVKEQRGERVS